MRLRDPRLKGPRLRDLSREGWPSAFPRRGNPRLRFQPGGNSQRQNRRCGELRSGGRRGKARLRQPGLPSSRRRSNSLLCRSALRRSARRSFALLKSADASLASRRLAPSRFAPWKFAYVRFTLYRFTRERSAPLSSARTPVSSPLTNFACWARISKRCLPLWRTPAGDRSPPDLKISRIPIVSVRKGKTLGLYFTKVSMVVHHPRDQMRPPAVYGKVKISWSFPRS